MTFDLDALKREDEGEPFTFKFGGEVYTLPAHVDTLAASALSGGDLYNGLRKMLGQVQWDLMLQSAEVMDEGRLTALLAAYQDHLGTTLGESAASTNS